jgi:hypothetical protein
MLFLAQPRAQRGTVYVDQWRWTFETKYDSVIGWVGLRALLTLVGS